MRIFLVILMLGLIAPMTGAQAKPPIQETAQPSVTDIVFSEIEKRVLREVLGDGRYEATRDGGYHKTAKDHRYDDLERGRDGKIYGDKKDKAGNGRGKGLPPGLAKKGKLPPGLQKQLERKQLEDQAIHEREMLDQVKTIQKIKFSFKRKLLS